MILIGLCCVLWFVCCVRLLLELCCCLVLMVCFILMGI